MAQGLEISVKIKPEIDDKTINAAVKQLEKTLKSLTVGNPVDAKEIETALKSVQSSLKKSAVDAKAMGDELKKASAAGSGIGSVAKETEKVSRSTKEAATSAEKLSTEFTKGFGAAAKNLGVAQQELGKLVKEQAKLSSAGADTTAIDKQVAAIKKRVQAEQATVDNLDRIAVSTKKAADGATVFSKAFQFNQITQALNTVTGAFSQYIKSYLEFDKQVQNVATLGVRNLEDVKSAALSIAVDVPDSVATVTEGIYNAISAGAIEVKEGILDIAQATEFVGIAAKLAVGGLTDTNSAIKGLASVVNAYGKGNLDAARAADILFATVQSGVTTIPELNASLAQVVPTAAAFGVSFEQVGGALATITKQGTATAEATTRLRALLTEVAKPGAELSRVLQQAGVSLETLGQEGLQTTVAKIGTTLDSLGLSASQVFSSVEAVGAVLALSGKNAAAAQADFIAISTGIGATDRAFAEASKGIAVNVQSIFNTIEAQFFTLFDTLGKGFVGSLAVLEQAQPQIQALAGIKQLLPAWQGFGAILDATKLKAAAFWAAATGPIGLTVAGIAAVTAALAIFFTQTETGQKVFEQLTQFAIASFEAIKSILGSVGGAISALFSGDFSGVADALGSAFEKAGTEFENSVNVQGLRSSIEKAFEIRPRIGEIENIDAVVAKLEISQRKLQESLSSGADETVITQLRAEVEGYSQALAKAVPSAVKGTKTISDEQGRLRTVYEVSTESVTNFTKAQRASVDKNLLNLRKQFLDGLRSEEAQYRANVEAVKGLEIRISEQAKAGKDVGGLVEEYEKLRSVTNDNAQELQKFIEEGRKSGLISDNVKEIAKQFGISEEEAARLLKTTQEIELATANTAKTAGQLGTEFKKSYDDSKGALQTSKLELAGLVAEQRRLTKEGTDPARLKQINAEIKAVRDRIKAEKQVAKELSSIDELAENAVSLKEKENKQSKSALVTAKEAFTTQKKNIEQRLRSVEIEEESQRIESGRAATIDEQVASINRRKAALEEELKLAQTLSTSARTADERAEVQDIINGLNAEILKQQGSLKQLEIKSRIDARQVANEAAKLQLEEQVIAFKLGRIDEQALRTSVESVNRQIEALSAELSITVDSDQRAKIVSEIGNLRKEANAVLADLDNQRLADVRRANGEEASEYAKTNEQILRQQQSRVNNEKRFLDIITKGRTAAIREGATAEIDERKKADDALLASIEVANRERINAIRENESSGVIDGVEAARQIAQIEQESASERVRIEEERALAITRIKEQEAVREQSLRGLALQAEREFRVAELHIIAQSLQEKQRLLEENARKEEELLLQQAAAAEARGDTGLAVRLQQEATKVRAALDDQRGAIGEQLEGIGAEIADKSSILNLAFEELGSTLETAAGDAFAGDWEGVRKGFKNLFGVLAGALSRLASSAILQLLFSPQSVAQLSAGGFLGAAALFGVAKATISALVNALLQPLLSSLTSFSTGGRIDSPTMALIGDASRLGGANTEWVMRDEQIKDIVSMAVSSFAGNLEAKIDRLSDILEQQQITTTLAGSDIRIALQRTETAARRREF